MNILPKVLLLDGDGVIWLSGKLIPGNIESLHRIKKLGIRLALVTNNPSKTRKQYYQTLKSLGLDCFDEYDIFSASYGTARYLKFKKYTDVFVSGFPSVISDIKDVGINVHTYVRGHPISFNQPIQSIVISEKQEPFYDDIGYAIDLDKKYNAELVGTDPDISAPRAHHIMTPCSGASVKLFEVALNKKATYLGKPSKIMLDIVLHELGITKNEAMMVGDCLSTDIAFASSNGMRSILVLTGMSTEQMGINAPDGQKPSFILPTLADVATMLENWKEQSISDI